MKRTPLKRNTEAARAFQQRGRESSARSLDERRAPLRSTGFGTRGDRKPLKRTTWTAPKGLTKTGACRNCGAEGSTDWHHAVHRSLSRIGRDDPRNLVELCRRCHDAHHAGVPLSRSMFTPEEWAFIEEIAPSTGWLSRHYPPADSTLGRAA